MHFKMNYVVRFFEVNNSISYDEKIIMMDGRMNLRLIEDNQNEVDR